jgi:DNA-binding NarL/FixJ family response regulator
MSTVAKDIRIVVADDHTMFREALRDLLAHEPDLLVVGEASNGNEAVEQVSQLEPDVLLLDLIMPRVSGTEVLRRLSGLHCTVRTIIVAETPQKHQVIEALILGARGVVPKFKSIRAVAAGEYWIGHKSISDLIDYLRDAPASSRGNGNSTAVQLTPREIDIVATIVDGYTNKEIANKLSISEQTVKHHLTNIFSKVGVSNRLELALFAMQHSPSH